MQNVSHQEYLIEVMTQSLLTFVILKIIMVLIDFRYGLRGRELVSSIGKIMLQGGGTFGVFMSVGTAIRC